MKMDLQWHRDCLAHRIAHITRIRDAAVEALLKSDRDAIEDRFYSDQINEAERRGLKAFDRDRLLKKRAK